MCLRQDRGLLGFHETPLRISNLSWTSQLLPLFATYFIAPMASYQYVWDTYLWRGPGWIFFFFSLHDLGGDFLDSRMKEPLGMTMSTNWVRPGQCRMAGPYPSKRLEDCWHLSVPLGLGHVLPKAEQSDSYCSSNSKMNIILLMLNFYHLILLVVIHCLFLNRVHTLNLMETHNAKHRYKLKVLFFLWLELNQINVPWSPALRPAPHRPPLLKWDKT